MQTMNAASVLPDPVGAAMSVLRPEAISGQPSRCGSVGRPKRSANQWATTGWNSSSGVRNKVLPFMTIHNVAGISEPPLVMAGFNGTNFSYPASFYRSQESDLRTISNVERVRFQVNQHVAQRGKPLQKSILDPVADFVPMGDRQVAIHFDVDVGEVFQAGLSQQ